MQLSISESDSLVTTNPDTDWTRTLIAGGFVGAALTVQTLIFYDPEEHKKNPKAVLRMSNILGTLTIAAGIIVSGAPSKEIARHIVIAAIGGGFVIAVDAIRHRQEQDRELRAGAHEAIGRSEGVRNSGWSLGDPAKLFN